MAASPFVTLFYAALAINNLKFVLFLRFTFVSFKFSKCAAIKSTKKGFKRLQIKEENFLRQ